MVLSLRWQISNHPEVSTLPCNPCHENNATSQKGKDKKKAKYDSLQELRKNKKELEFEQKLYKEKEEMLEKEKQLKINRLAQEVSETEREDLEESEKIQYWVERLCQTRLEQISSADTEISEVTETSFHRASCCLHNGPPWEQWEALWPLASITIQGCPY